MTEWFITENTDLGYSPSSILISMALALVLGLIIGWIYRYTHRGLSYSQSFVITLVLMCVTVSAVMMVIGSNLARAFALVGALTIVRFRTVVKDPKDTAFIFFALTEGIASGTGNHILAAISTAFIGTIALVLAKINFGAIIKTEFILRFRYNREAGGEDEYVQIISELTKSNTLIHIEPSGEGRYLTITYDIFLRSGVRADELARRLEQTAGVDNLSMVYSRNDVDY